MPPTARSARTLWFTTLLLVLAGALAAAPAGARPAPSSTAAMDFAALDAAVAAQMQKHGLPGVALAVVQGEQIVYLKGYGTAGGGRPMTPQTPMYIGSQSKSVTALAVAQLVEQGKLDVNAPVQRYLPWFRVADEAASRKITVANLLHHTSGLSEAGFTTILPENAAYEDAARALASAQLTAPVGAKHQYFNVGYDVLAVVIENVSGMTFEQYVQENIFAPLEMQRTFTDPEAAGAAGLAQGYSRFYGFAVPQRQPHRAYEVSAGFIISTAEDLAHYAIAMLNGGSYAGRAVISPQGLNRMFRPIQGYGWGWYISPGRINHGGANETFRTHLDLYPAEKLGIVLLINQGYMLDHYISGGQVFAAVEAVVQGRQAPQLSQGWATPVIGWALLALVLGLTALHTYNIYNLRTWAQRAAAWSKPRLAWDVALSFLIPTVILVVVFSQIRAFFGTRFNLTYQMVQMFTSLTDVSILMLVGSLPDYFQGVVKLAWVLRGRDSASSRS
jgi:CubicO group peptidase (beta-lactamase class C family)